MDREQRYTLKYENVDIESEDMDILDALIHYADAHSGVDWNLISSMKKFAVKYRHLTAAQYNVLVKIYEQNKVEEKGYW